MHSSGEGTPGQLAQREAGVQSEGSLPRPQVGIVWGRKGSEDLGAPWVPGSSLREAGLAPSPPPASEAHSAEAAQGSGGQPSYSLPSLWPGVWRPQPEPGVQGLSHRVPQWLTGAWEGGPRGAGTPLALFQSCLLSMDLAAECAPDNPRPRQGAPGPVATSNGQPAQWQGARRRGMDMELLAPDPGPRLPLTRLLVQGGQGVWDHSTPGWPVRPTLRPIREPWPEKPRVELPGRSAEGPSWSPGGVLLVRDGVGWGAEASILNTGHPRVWTVSPGAACQPRVLLPCSEHAGRSQATLGGCAPAGRVPGHPGELGGDAHSEAFLRVTSKRTASRSVSRPLLFSCHPEPLQGRLCARAISGDPFLPQATHPGVTVGMTKKRTI